MPGRALETARGCWGAALLLWPSAVLRDADDITVDARSLAVTRVLGARQLTQSLLSGRRPSPEVLAMGTWVDGVHALTALGLTVADRSRARAGLVDAVIASAWAVAGHRDLVRAGATPPAHDRRRDALARHVLSVVPGGRRLLGSVDRVRSVTADSGTSMPTA